MDMSNGEYLLGIDYGTESCRVGIFDLEGRPVAFEATPYKLTHPRPGWAEQDVDEWWSALKTSIRGCLDKSGTSPDAIAGISYDATTCTPVALDANGRPLRKAIMWMDVRAGDQARRIAESTNAARKYNAGGTGPVSAEWYPSKALWVKENEPDIWKSAAWFVECDDWLNWKLTGRWTASINTAAMRAFHNRDLGGWATDFYEEIGLGDALGKLPEEVVDMGVHVGDLTRECAEELGLKAGTPVAQGGADAFVGQIGLNVVSPGKMAYITGSSHVLAGQVDHEVHGEGFFGGYTDAIMPGQYTVEGGQVSTGSVMKWFKDHFAKDVVAEAERTGRNAYDLLNERAKNIPIGSDGLIVVEYFQGNRTPWVDGDARGIVYGLSLAHTPDHVYRAIQEGCCYGSAHILRFMAQAGFEVQQFVACGGWCNSRDLMQTVADVTGVPVTLTEVGDAPVLGSSILAAAGAGLFGSVQEAAGAMVHETDTLEPDKAKNEEYQFYIDAYADTWPQMRDLTHRVVRHHAAGNNNQAKSVETEVNPEGGGVSAEQPG
jgi:FGGY-family pentulose kinase